MATQEQLNNLRESVDGGVQVATNSLADLKGQLVAYDEKYKLSESATVYLHAAIDRANSAVEELRKTAGGIKESTSSAAKVPVHVVEGALQKVNEAMSAVKTQAINFDEKVRSNVSSKKDALSTSIEQLANNAREKSNAAIGLAQQQVENIKSSINSRAQEAGNSAYTIAGGVANKLAEYDEYYNVSTRVTAAAVAATEKAKALDEYYGVSKTASSLDQKVTGGIGSNAVVKGSEIVNHSVEFVTDQVHKARTAANGEVTAPAPEAAAAVAGKEI